MRSAGILRQTCWMDFWTAVVGPATACDCPGCLCSDVSRRANLIFLADSPIQSGARDTIRYSSSISPMSPTCRRASYSPPRIPFRNAATKGLTVVVARCGQST